MNCTCYKWSNGKWYGTNYCLKEKCKISERYYQEYCCNANYDKCKYYQENRDRDCFFTTILCEKNIPSSLNVEILMNLKAFRKNVLEKNHKYMELLVLHDGISPMISDAIRYNKISSIDEFLNVIYSNYIVPINNFILNRDVENAVKCYNKMLGILVVNFSLGSDLAGIKYHYNHPELFKVNTKKRKLIK